MAALRPKSFIYQHRRGGGAKTTLTVVMVMEVTTENGELTPPYLFHRGKCDVQVAHGRLWEAFHGLTLFKEGQATAGLLAGISDLGTERDVFTVRDGL